MSTTPFGRSCNSRREKSLDKSPSAAQGCVLDCGGEGSMGGKHITKCLLGYFRAATNGRFLSVGKLTRRGLRRISVPKPGHVCTLFLGLVAAMILLPCVQSIFPLIRGVPIDEHRTLTAFPNLALLKNGGVAALIDATNRWVEDHIGLRDLFIRTKNQIDYSLFNTSRKVYLGTDGWLFDRERTDDRFELERLSEHDFSIVQASFHELAEMLGQRGVRLVLVGYPDKAMIYKDYLPADAPRPPDGGKLARLRASLASDPSMIFIDVEKLLLPLKNGPPLFHRTDLHPTLHSTVAVVREIIRRLAEAEQRPDVAWHQDLRWRDAGYYTDGGEARFLALLRPFGEEVSGPGPMDTVGNSESDGRWTFDQRQVSYSFGVSPIFRWAFESSANNCASRLPGAMLWGNSFSDTYEALWLPHYFCFMKRAKTPIERLPPFIADMPAGTRYFIFQFVDTYLPCEAPLIKEKLSVSYACTM